MTVSDYPQRPLALRACLAVLALIIATVCVGLAVWQIERREWKHELIAAVEERVHQALAAAPARGEWAGLSAETDAYRKVTATGTFSHDKEVLVQAVTDLGGGFWVMTPLVTPEFTVWINRGYITPDQRDPAGRDKGLEGATVTITGLLRLTEPEGGFLRDNAGEADKWYSRDVAAMSQARGLTNTAPYFIDADASSDGSFAANPPSMGPAMVQAYPVGGLTVVKFSDNHLVYAVTWLVLALLSLAAAWLVLADGRIRRNKA